jgi:ABC-type glycerol-3-phosphate transport system permease component
VYRFPLQNFLFILMLSTLMVPIQVTSVSLYMLMARFGWIDIFPGILAPNFASAFGVFFMRQTIKGMPNDLIDAARIDGAEVLAACIRPHGSMPTQMHRKE